MSHQLVGGAQVAVAALALVDRAVDDVVRIPEQGQVAGLSELVDHREKPVPVDVLRLLGDAGQGGRGGWRAHGSGRTANCLPMKKNSIIIS